MHFTSREHFVLLLILQDKMDAVERLRRVEAFNREKQLQNIEADNLRIAEINHKKYKLQQEKIQMRKEQVSACCPVPLWMHCIDRSVSPAPLSCPRGAKMPSGL